MFSKYTEVARKILLNMSNEMMELKHPYVGSEHLLLALLKYGENENGFNDTGVCITQKTRIT